MNRLLALIVAILSLCSSLSQAKDKVYRLSGRSDEYNIRYLYHQSFIQPILRDTVVYIGVDLPESFVLELAGPQEGEKSVLVYNDDQEMSISMKNGRYVIDGRSFRAPAGGGNKLSFYYINGKLIVYVDDKKAGKVKVDLNPKKRIGVKWKADGTLSYDYLCCYEICEFKDVKYGEMFDDGVFRQMKSFFTSQSIGKDYSLNFPADVTCHSPRSMRFEYRFEDAKTEEDKSKTQRTRSEISGVHSSSLMGKWIIEFDFLIPEETMDDAENKEIITQLHEGSDDAISPAFCLGMWKGELFCRLRGDNIPIGQWKKRNVPAGGTHLASLAYLEKGVWHHVKVFLREAYQQSMNPLTVVWLDSKKVFESRLPNCYNYEPRKQGAYNYLKFGIYKSAWINIEECGEEKSRRVYYFDNYKVRY